MLCQPTLGEGAPGPSELTKPQLWVADFDLDSRVIFCAACGAYSSTVARKLAERCLGARAGPGLAAQKKRLARGLHPRAALGNARLGPARRPPQVMLREIDRLASVRLDRARRALPRPGAKRPRRQAPSAQPRGEILASSGFDKVSFDAFVGKFERLAASRKRGAVTPADDLMVCQTFDSDSESALE